ncbi:MAG TPA: hypothetical protein VL201_01240 [Patescibacteria group bacterium]|jgi:uncharacterized membrane protein (Fun14 family)|nr:hypothetical protein [Patescibacteria group bacterium]
MQGGNVEVAEQKAILETVKEKVNLQTFFEKVQDSRGIILDIAIFGCVGFLSGYLLKRYINAVITMIITGVILFMMQQFSLLTITIHWEILYELLGITQVINLVGDNLGLFIFEWAKANVFLVTSSLIGFLIGIKIG